MEEPAFLDRSLVEELHSESLLRYGGISGTRDFGLLESAIHSAQNTYFYAHGDNFEIAAAYTFHIAQAQAFFDGNKRTATACALTFLAANGIIPQSSENIQSEIYNAMIAIAEKRIDKTGLATLFRTLFS